MTTNQIEILDKNYVFGKGPLNKHLCKTFVKISAMRWIFIFPIISLWMPKVAIAIKVL